MLFGLNLPNYFDFITHQWFILDNILNEFPIKLGNLCSSLAGDNFNLSKNICALFTLFKMNDWYISV